MQKDKDKPTVVSVLKCKEKVPLQWLQNALDSARKDFKEIGRPLTFSVHDGEYLSILSESLNGREGKPVQLRGLVNLLILLLLVTNIKNIILSVRHNGFTMTKHLK